MDKLKGDARYTVNSSAAKNNPEITKKDKGPEEEYDTKHSLVAKKADDLIATIKQEIESLASPPEKRISPARDQEAVAIFEVKENINAIITSSAMTTVNPQFFDLPKIESSAFLEDDLFGDKSFWN